MSARTSPGRSARSLATRRRDVRTHSLSPLSRGEGVFCKRRELAMSAALHSPGTAAPAPEKILSVNNIEVIYDHVILVLKGVSLDVDEGRHRRAARRQRRRQDHDAEGDLEPAAFRARRGDQGLDRVRGRRRCRIAVAERTGAARLHPGDGRPALLRPSHHRGKSAHRRLHPQGRQAPRSRAISNWSTAISSA